MPIAMKFAIAQHPNPLGLVKITKQVRFRVGRIISSSSYNIITIQLELEMIANANPNVCLWL
jgi:hypothetical protein